MQIYNNKQNKNLDKQQTIGKYIIINKISKYIKKINNNVMMANLTVQVLQQTRTKSTTQVCKMYDTFNLILTHQ